MLFSTIIKGFSRVSKYFHANRYTSIVAVFLVFLLSAGFSPISAQTNSPSPVSCPADITTDAEPGKCGAVVNFAATVAADQPYSILYSKPSGVLYPVGTTNVTAKLVDQNGRTVSSCSFNITVVDKEAPVIKNYSPDITVATAANECGATVSYDMPAIVQNCSNLFLTYLYSGAPQIFTVPEGVTSVRVDVKGAAGGLSSSNGYTYGNPGLGGRVEATIAVTPGERLSIYVGGAGGSGTGKIAGSGGFNGGAQGTAYIDQYNADNNYAGGGGGGASDIRRLSSSLSDRLVVAGGGGASGYYGNGGHGGGLTGGEGFSAVSNATGGTQTAGGKGGSYYNGFVGDQGGFGVGGKGADESQGGGGGAGWYGGGGGAFGDGGGGSSYAAPGITGVLHTQGYQEGDGTITIKWVQPATLVQTAGLPSGAVFPVGTTVNTFAATDAAGNTSQSSFTVTVQDNQKPELVAPATQNLQLNTDGNAIPALIARDNCGIASITYSITGATGRQGAGTSASGTFNAGSSQITWTVTDVHGNVQTAATEVNITAGPSLNISIPDVYAVSTGGKPNTLYLGYGSEALLLNAITAAGIPPYTYKWTKSADNTVLSTARLMQATAQGEYTVTVTDATGAYGIAKKTIASVDVRCGNKNEKVIVIQAKKDNSKPQCVDKNSVADLLSSGGVLGSVTDASARTALIESAAPEVTVEVNNRVDIFPNPAPGVFFVQLSNFSGTKAEILLLSQSGMTINKKTVKLNGAIQKVSFNNRPSAGVYFIKVISENVVQTRKVIIR